MPRYSIRRSEYIALQGVFYVDYLNLMKSESNNRSDMARRPSQNEDANNDDQPQPAGDPTKKDYYAALTQSRDQTRNETISPCAVHPKSQRQDHCFSTLNFLPLNSRSAIIQPPLDRLINTSHHTSVAVQGLSLTNNDSYCFGNEIKSGEHNRCRNNNTEQTLPGRDAVPISNRTEYSYKGAVDNHTSITRKVKKSRLVITLLVCVIAGLAAGLIYFLLDGKAGSKGADAASDDIASVSSHLSNQTRLCATIPTKYASSAWRDSVSSRWQKEAENTETELDTNDTFYWGDPSPLQQELPSGDLPIRIPVQARIYGGTNVAILKFPWQVSLWLKVRGMYCGGALIMSNWIVTAAHCTYYERNASSWTAYLGMSRLSEKHFSPAQTAKVERIFENPMYEASWNYDSDISLLKLTESVRFSSHVQPICLPTPDQKFGDESSCSISGWGSIANTGVMVPPDTLQSGKVDIISQQTCRSEDWLGEFLVTDNMICAGKADGSIDACSGDSGGPLSCHVKERGVWVLAGVVSFGRGCGQPRQPGVYTKISAFAEWIWATIGEHD